MLVLSRKLYESVSIGPDITVTIVGIRGSNVRVAIEAPNAVPITRDDAIKTKPRKREVQNNGM